MITIKNLKCVSIGNGVEKVVEIEDKFKQQQIARHIEKFLHKKFSMIVDWEVKENV